MSNAVWKKRKEKINSLHFSNPGREDCMSKFPMGVVWLLDTLSELFYIYLRFQDNATSINLGAMFTFDDAEGWCTEVVMCCFFSTSLHLYSWATRCHQFKSLAKLWLRKLIIWCNTKWQTTIKTIIHISDRFLFHLGTSTQHNISIDWKTIAISKYFPSQK